jgi:hypothetical protein
MNTSCPSFKKCRQRQSRRVRVLPWTSRLLRSTDRQTRTARHSNLIPNARIPKLPPIKIIRLRMYSRTSPHKPLPAFTTVTTTHHYLFPSEPIDRPTPPESIQYQSSNQSSTDPTPITIASHYLSSPNQLSRRVSYP